MFSFDLKSIVIGALVCLFVVSVFGNSPLPEPAQANITRYEIVTGAHWGIRDGKLYLGEINGQGSLADSVNVRISNKWRPFGGVSIGPSGDLYQAMVK